MSSTAEAPQAESSNGPQLIRITRSGKIKGWVANALESFEKYEDRPIVFHTLPASPKTKQINSENTNEDEQESPEAREHGKSSNQTHLTTIPRLISVVEITKREFLKNLEKNKSTRLAGLHQYNEVGCLEDLGLVDAGSETASDQSRSAAIAMALEGKNFPKRKQSPYMKITLSTLEIQDLEKAGATYQPPLMRKISRAAKIRAKKKQKKTAVEESGGNNAS